MKNLLNQIIEEFDGPVTLFGEPFLNEAIFDKNLSNSKFYNCSFQNCQILGSDLTRAEFGNSIFTTCQFKKVDLSASWFGNSQFSETKFEKILLIGAILSDLKIETTTFVHLQFSETYPVRIHKDKLKKLRKVSDSISF